MLIVAVVGAPLLGWQGRHKGGISAILYCTALGLATPPSLATSRELRQRTRDWIKVEKRAGLRTEDDLFFLKIPSANVVGRGAAPCNQTTYSIQIHHPSRD